MLSSTPQLSLVVAEVTWTAFDAPDATVPQSQVSTPPPIEQPLSEPAASIDQDTPALAGSGSVTVTPPASPAPEFAAVIRNPT